MAKLNLTEYLMRPISQIEKSARDYRAQGISPGNETIQILLLAKILQELEVMNERIADIRGGYDGRGPRL